MNYIVVRGDTAEKLTEKVNYKINQGYVPLGGVSTVHGKEENGRISYTSVAPTGKYTVYVEFIQAMVIRDLL